MGPKTRDREDVVRAREAATKEKAATISRLKETTFEEES